MAEQCEVVAFRSVAASTVCSVLWTHRITSCDVISTVTTVHPSKAAHAVALVTEDAARASKSMAGGFNWGTPLEETAQDRKSRMRRLLRAERDEFMRRLHEKRTRRSVVENAAATKIQSQFRGYRVRAHGAEIRHRCEVRKRVRAALREKLDTHGIVLSAKQHSEQRSEVHNHAAIRIQSSFRRFFAQNTVQRMRPEYHRMKLLAAVIIIQSAFRLWKSKNIRTITSLESRVESGQTAALIIQCAVRRHQAILRVARRKRKLRQVAALIIQCMYRSSRARRVARQSRLNSSTRKRYAAGTQVQRLVRRFLGRRRRKRLQANNILRACLLIQTQMRRYLCAGRVACRRQQARENVQHRSATVIQRHARGMVCRRKRRDAKLLQQCDVLDCARRGDLAGLQDAAELLTDVATETNADGDNILIVAAREGHLPIVRQALDWGIDIDAANAWGESAVVAAIKAKQVDVASYLLVKGCNAEAHIETLLFEAAAAGMVEVLQTLIGNGHDVDTICNDSEETALFGACQHGVVETAKLLIECGADVHKRNADGHTVLHRAAAAATQDVQLLQLLLEAGLDASSGAEIPGLPASHAETGRTPWLSAILYERTTTLRHLKSVASFPSESGRIIWNDDDMEAALKLCEADQLECVRQLCDWGMDCNAQSSTSNDTLILAAARGSAQSVMAELLRRNVRLDTVNKNGRSVLHEACASTSPEVTTELIIRMHSLTAALIGQPDRAGITPLHEAAASGVSVDLIDRAGVEAAVNIRTGDGLTALMIACLYKHYQVALSLLGCGADALTTDSKGRTALHYCYARGPAQSLQAYVASKHRRLVFPTSDAPLHESPGSSSPARTFISMRQSVIRQLIAHGCNLAAGSRPVIRYMMLSRDDAILLETMEAVQDGFVWELLLAAVQFDFADAVLGALKSSVLRNKLIAAATGAMSLETTTHRGKTIAGWAVEFQSVESLKAVLRMGWDLHRAADTCGNNLLHLASANGDVEILKLLLQSKSVQLEAPNHAGLTSLAVAVERNHEAVARLLIKHGANVQAALRVRTEAWLLARLRSNGESTEEQVQDADALLWYLHPEHRDDGAIHHAQ